MVLIKQHNLLSASLQEVTLHWSDLWLRLWMLHEGCNQPWFALAVQICVQVDVALCSQQISLVGLSTAACKFKIKLLKTLIFVTAEFNVISATLWEKYIEQSMSNETWCVNYQVKELSVKHCNKSTIHTLAINFPEYGLLSLQQNGQHLVLLCPLW